MATTTGLMTVDELRQLPDTSEEYYYELHYGVPVQMTWPKLNHIWIQSIVHRRFLEVAGERFLICTEFPYRALPEHDFRCADVGALSAECWARADKNSDLFGVPEIVVEVLSPSNTAEEIADKERLCLENGCLQFWVISQKRKTVRVSRPDGTSITYIMGQEIPLDLLGGGTFPVRDIFPE